MARSKASSNGGTIGNSAMTRERFTEKAPSTLSVTIGGKPFDVGRKNFSTGSVGYFGSGKVMLEVDGEPVTFQVGLNIIAVGSKTGG